MFVVIAEGDNKGAQFRRIVPLKKFDGPIVARVAQGGQVCVSGKGR